MHRKCCEYIYDMNMYMNESVHMQHRCTYKSTSAFGETSTGSPSPSFELTTFLTYSMQDWQAQYVSTLAAGAGVPSACGYFEVVLS